MRRFLNGCIGIWIDRFCMGRMRVQEETKCCALEAGPVMLKGRFLPVRGGVQRETFFYANLDCQLGRRACRRPRCG